MSSSLPGWMQANQRAIKGPVNSMDRATIVSIFPRRIEEVKVTLEPGLFIIAPGTLENPTTLTVGTSSWWREIDTEQPLLEIPVPSVQVAHSIVTDYSRGLLDCDMENRIPGIFYVDGAHSPESIKKDKKHLLELANVKQRAWYQKLVVTADVLWARTNGNPLAVPELARLAARELNLVDKAWLKDTHTMELVKCLACQMLIGKSVVVCPNCKVVVDAKKFKELNLQFAGA